MVDIKANIVFIKKQASKPYYDSSAITGLVPKLYFKVEKKVVSIFDARNITTNTFEKSGYEMCLFKSKYNSRNIDENLENYKNELKDFLKKKFNFIDIFIFDLTRRSNSVLGAKNIDGNRQPAERAHVDYTDKSGKIRAKDILGENYYNKVVSSGKRIIQLNAWRPLCKTILSSPLAFALPKTVLKRDLVETDQRFPDRVGEIYHLAYNKAQKWFWISKMKNSEILLLKGWDSTKKKGVPRYTPHASFNLENQDIVKNPRDSIEARIFLVINK